MLRFGVRCSCRTIVPCARPLHDVHGRRSLLTIALETSCDDTSVAILERKNRRSCDLLFHEKVTANNSAFGGVHPIVSLESHQENLANLIDNALPYLSNGHYNGTKSIFLRQSQVPKAKPDFISVTRGPGMRSSLTAGLDTAKGLSVAWQVPLIGVNHMQAHALTPRLVSMLENPTQDAKPAFPFLSLLVSGGHTLLVHSKNVIEHKVLAKTTDIAVGDAIDKIARSVLPPTILQAGGEIMYGRLLERFTFPHGALDHNYKAPVSRQEEIARRETQWGWSLLPPLSGSKSRSTEFAYSGLDSAVRKICETNPEMSVDERIDLARESMRIAFEHLATRVGLALHDLRLQGQDMETLVVSGGVASNDFLKTILRSFLAARGFPKINLIFPPIALCTDNAAMIAWTGMEMYERGWESDLKCRVLKKWSIDPEAEDGGILGADCWRKRSVP